MNSVITLPSRHNLNGGNLLRVEGPRYTNHHKGKPDEHHSNRDEENLINLPKISVEVRFEFDLCKNPGRTSFFRLLLDSDFRTRDSVLDVHLLQTSRTFRVSVLNRSKYQAYKTCN